MREEDLDWKIYHIIVEKEKCPVSLLVDLSGTDSNKVLLSLKRLEKNCLVKFNNENVEILSLQETIMKNCLKNALTDTNSPVIIQNGIIKENPNYKG
ncbi:MAG: MarR family transcriptional regulator [Methanomicrobium sp.]|nr:MarR family transcriptional regulator [Methanomicrobium sp.]